MVSIRKQLIIFSVHVLYYKYTKSVHKAKHKANTQSLQCEGNSWYTETNNYYIIII